jgi:PilZ domain-containing protein
MPVFIEKRKHHRFDHITSNIKYTKSPEIPYMQALLINYSENGMFLKTNEHMDIDQMVLVRLDDSSENAISHDMLNSSQGVVRWMDHYYSHAHGTLYRYGIEFS